MLQDREGITYKDLPYISEIIHIFPMGKSKICYNISNTF